MKIGRESEANAVSDFRLANLLRNIILTVDGNLSIGDNIQGKIVRGVLFKVANFDYPVEHNLGRVITDYVILNQNGFARFMLGLQTPTKNRLYIRSDTANITADVLILG